jgi:diguanylate cyclase (GGDEF)-like protein
MTSRGLTRVASVLIWPAVAFTGRLRYAQKFAVVGLVLLLPLASVAVAYVGQQRREIGFSTKERHGVALLAPLTVLTAHLVAARHELVTSGGRDGSNLHADLARLDTLNERLGRRLGTTEDWRSTRRTIEAAEHNGGELMVRYEAYNTAVDAALALIVRVGDQSNLTLDPELDTYYLMDILQFRLPVLLDVAGRVSDRAVFMETTALAGSDTFIDLGVFNGVVANTHRAITRAARTVVERTRNPEVRRVAADQYYRLHAVVAAFEEQIRGVVQSRQVGAAVSTGAESVHAAASGFAAESAAALHALLRTRIAGLSARAIRVELGGGLAALLALYLFVGFYVSVVSPIRLIVGALQAVAGGDLARRVAVQTHDELSFVARALNDTIHQTEIATNRLGKQATHDTLTGLPNRAYVLDHLDRVLDLVRRGEGPALAVLFIDLDRFKIINDSLGHAVGDEVLRTVAARLTRVLRPADIVARLAGDEFIVVSQGLERLPDLREAAERIVDEVRKPITVTTPAGERVVGIGASIGVAVADGTPGSVGSAGSAAELLHDADVAMYRAKERGRGRVEIFDEGMRNAVESRLEVQDELRRSVETGQIVVHYQPILDTTTARVIGFEALARWNHPTRGLVGATELITVAERTGLIHAVGASVLAQACRQAAHWRATRPECADVHIAVNVSGTQFAEATFADTVAEVLTDTGLEPGALWLEITETSVMAETGTTKETVDTVRALGVNLVIDDFGTGYSSLAYLRRFQVTALKIDRSFVASLGQDPVGEAIVTTIVGLADALRLLVVGEGVETAEQLDLLRRMGCPAAQGTLLAPPAPGEQVWDLLAGRAAQAGPSAPVPAAVA